MVGNIRKKKWFIFFEGCLYRFPLHLHLRSFVRFYILVRIIDIFLLLPAILYYFIFLKHIKYDNNDSISAVFIVKNEGDYLDELISYYLAINFDKLIFYDNMSTDNTAFIIHKYLNSGKVEYHKIHGKSRQKDVYNIAFNKYGKKYKYMAFIDADEFLRINSLLAYNEIDNVFETFKDKKIGSIAVPWIVYGSSGFIHKPDGFMIKNYKKRLPFGVVQHLKPIVKTACFFYQRNPHVPCLKEGYKYISPSGEICECSTTVIKENEPLYLNHYYYKSIEEFHKKIIKGNVYGDKVQKKMDWLYDTDKLCVDDDFVCDQNVLLMEEIINRYSN